MTAEARRRAVRLTLRLGVELLARGAQAQEAEVSLREVMHALGLRGGDAIVTSSSVTVSYVAPGDAEATTAIQSVREWRYDYARLAAAGALACAVRDGKTDLAAAEAELDRIDHLGPAYPRWLVFAAPALLSASVTIMFGGSAIDSLATLAIGLVIQPAQQRIEAGTLPLFFQVVFGVSATTFLVVLLVGFGLPIDGSLVLTGGLLRFLPGGQLVAGMRDLLARAIVPGTANMAEVALLGVAIAAAASLMLAIGQALHGIDLRVDAEGRLTWPDPLVVAAGAAAVAASAIRLSVPRDILPTVALLGAVIVIVAKGFLPPLDRIEPDGRTLVAALIVGAVGRWFAERRKVPPALWLVPAMLPLLPAPATLVPALAATEAARAALQSEALATALLIGVGVASGDILVSAIRRRWRRGRAAAAGRQ